MQSNDKIYDVIIVGGGLSGLVVAHGLQHDNDDDTAAPSIDWLLLEAQSTLGGRLANDKQQHSNQIDMGGTWIWPQAQPKIRDLVNHVLQLKTFAQPDDPSSTRIEGGAVQLIDKLAEQLPTDQIQLNAPVVSCTIIKNDSDDDPDDSHVVQLVTAAENNKETLLYYHARRVVFAVPPKLIETHIQFDPPLSAAKRQAMASCHTWMAGVTKVALVYPERFWNFNYSNMGLARSSTSAQEAAPAFQVYDGSTRDGSVAALTFFCLVPPSSPAIDDDKLLAEQVARQMADTWRQLLPSPEATRMAEKATHYSRFCVQRWPLQKYISENPKPPTICPHPHPVAALARPEWDEGRLEFCASETDQRDPGVMEGAVGAAHRVLQSLRATKSKWFKR